MTHKMTVIMPRGKKEEGGMELEVVAQVRGGLAKRKESSR